MGFVLTFISYKSGVKLSHQLLEVPQAVYWQGAVPGCATTKTDVKAYLQKWRHCKERHNGEPGGELSCRQLMKGLRTQRVAHNMCYIMSHPSPTVNPKAWKNGVYFSAGMCPTEVLTLLKVL